MSDFRRVWCERGVPEPCCPAQLGTHDTIEIGKIVNATQWLQIATVSPQFIVATCTNWSHWIGEYINAQKAERSRAQMRRLAQTEIDQEETEIRSEEKQRSDQKKKQGSPNPKNTTKHTVKDQALGKKRKIRDAHLPKLVNIKDLRQM